MDAGPMLREKASSRPAGAPAATERRPGIRFTNVTVAYGATVALVADVAESDGGVLAEDAAGNAVLVRA